MHSRRSPNNSQSLLTLAALATAAASAAHDIGQHLSPTWNKTTLSKLLSAAQVFYSGKPEVTNYLLEQAKTVAGIISKVPGVQACCATGYPFYAISRQDGGPLRIPSIPAFVASVRKELNKEPASEWACLRCPKFLESDDPKNNCKPCTETSLKPRKMLAALPDLDITIIRDNSNPNLESDIEKAIHRAGYLQSDLSLEDALNKCATLTRELSENGRSDTKLPIDLHIWSLDDVRANTAALLDGKNPSIPTRSMYRPWKDDTMNLGFDFAFSLTVLAGSNSISSYLIQVRQAFAQRVASGQIDLVESLSSTSPRARELLGIDVVKNALLERVNSWA